MRHLISQSVRIENVEGRDIIEGLSGPLVVDGGKPSPRTTSEGERDFPRSPVVILGVEK